MPRGQMGGICELRWMGRYEGIVRTVVTSKVYVIYKSIHIQILQNPVWQAKHTGPWITSLRPLI